MVVFWGGAEFHRASLSALRHGAATMDTLISIGTLAAWAWSAVAILFLDAGGLHYRMSIDWSLQTGGSPGEDLYLEVAAVVTTLVLTGRFFEAPRKAPGRGCAARAAGAGRAGGNAAAWTEPNGACPRHSWSLAIASWCGRVSASPPTDWCWTAGRRSTARS